VTVGDPDGRDPFIRRATVIAAFVFLGLAVFVVMAQVFGRAILGPTYDVGDLVVSGIFGTLLAILGIGGAIKFINRDGK
jgi:hypothetical protein